MMKILKKADGYLINLAVLVAAWGGLSRRSFNNDTLWHMVSPGSDILVQVQDGRYLNSLIDWLLLKLGLSTTTHSGITALFTLVLLALALCFIQESLRQRIKPEGIREIICFYALTALLFVNVLFVESLFFGECAPAFGFAYLFASIGVWFFSRRRYLPSFLLFLAATTGYQVSVVYGAIIVSVIIFIDNRFIITKETVKEQLLALVFTFGAGVINLLSTKLLVAAGVIEELRKASGLGNLLEKLPYMWENYNSLLRDSKDILPDLWLPGLFLFGSAVLVLATFIRSKNRKAMVYFILLFVALNGMIYGIPFMQAYIYLPPRIVWVVYAVQSMVALLALLCTQGRAKMLFCYVCCGYLLMQLMIGNIIVAERKVSNTLDQVYGEMVYEKIVEYEQETGIRVTKLSVVNDAACPLSYDQISYKVDQINERALGTVSNTLVNVVSGRNFEKVPMDEQVYSQYFEGKDWKYFDASRQLVILGDTAYWAIF